MSILPRIFQHALFVLALAPLIVVWFGLGIMPKLLVTFLVAFFPIVISTVVGLRSVEREMIELAHELLHGLFQGGRRGHRSSLLPRPT